MITGSPLSTRPGIASRATMSSTSKLLEALTNGCVQTACMSLTVDTAAAVMHVLPIADCVSLLEMEVGWICMHMQGNVSRIWHLLLEVSVCICVVLHSMYSLMHDLGRTFLQAQAQQACYRPIWQQLTWCACRCKSEKGEDSPECRHHQKAYRSICPSEWVCASSRLPLRVLLCMCLLASTA